MKNARKDIPIHAVLIVFAALTLLPFVFVVNNSLRTNTEMNHSFFGLPKSLNTAGYVYAWTVLRPYILNTLIVCAATVFGVVTLGLGWALFVLMWTVTVGAIS